MSRKAKSDDAVVAEWLAVMAIATDRDSPFAGMVDLTEIFKLPIHVQRRIHDAMTPEQLERLTELYGAPTKDAAGSSGSKRGG